jgi:hypothetical protein
MNGRLINKLREKFITFPTELIKDSSLSCSARILFAFFLIEDGKASLDENELINNLGLSGMDELEKLLQKLVDSKWLKRDLQENGRFVYEPVSDRK